VTTLQALSPELKPLSHQKKKGKLKTGLQFLEQKSNQAVLK
jgi:hypothetical protein